MYKSQADAIKDWLKAYQQNELHIDQQLEKLRTLRARMTSIAAQEITDMPRAPSSPKDRMSEYMVRVDELERSIKMCIEIQDFCKATLQELIKKLESPKQRKIIKLRYLYGMEWSDVTRECYKDKPDYDVKLQAYQKRVYRDHERALLEMARKWSSVQKRS